MFPEIRKQTISITESAREQAKIEAELILKSESSSVKEKEIATRTLQKIRDIQQQFGAGWGKMARPSNDDRTEKVKRKFMDEDELLKSFYDAEEELPERTVEFWATKDVLKMGPLKLKMAFCKENNADFLFISKTNAKVSPTLMKVAFIELQGLYDKMEKMHLEILNTPVGQLVPFLDGPLGCLSVDDENFFSDEVMIGTKSGSLKIRPFYTPDASIRFKFLAPRPNTKYSWPGPTFTSSFLLFGGIMKFIRYVLENYEPQK